MQKCITYCRAAINEDNATTSITVGKLKDYTKRPKGLSTRSMLIITSLGIVAGIMIDFLTTLLDQRSLSKFCKLRF